MKNISFCVLFFLCLTCLCGCDKYELYDKGYEAAWEEEEGPMPWASKYEKEGYREGVEDHEIYESGYEDGYDKKKPEFLNDDLYMDGYRDGKKDRKN